MCFGRARETTSAERGGLAYRSLFRPFPAPEGMMSSVVVESPYRSRRGSAEIVARRAAAVGCAALAAGLLVGALGGRLAMRLLAAVNPEDGGLLTDDGFSVGQVTSVGTAQLALAAIQLTMVGATVFMLVRPFLLGRGTTRVALCAAGFGLTAAALLVDPDGTDFSQLQPLWLAEALFVMLPVALVAVFAALAERWLAPGSWFLSASPARVLPLLALWVLGGPALLVAVPLFLGALLVALLARRRPAAPPAVRWGGRGALVLIAGSGVWNLVSDTAEILG